MLDREGAIASVRQNFHIAELFFLNLITVTTLSGLFISANQYIALSSLPSELHVLQFLLDTGAPVQTRLAQLWSGSCMLLAVSVPLCAARVSGVAFFYGLGTMLLTIYLMIHTIYPVGATLEWNTK